MNRYRTKESISINSRIGIPAGTMVDEVEDRGDAKLVALVGLPIHILIENGSLSEVVTVVPRETLRDTIYKNNEVVQADPDIVEDIDMPNFIDRLAESESNSEALSILDEILSRDKTNQPDINEVMKEDVVDTSNIPKTKNATEQKRKK